MARAFRFEVENGWYHVTARGNERRAIFRDDPDRQRFLDLLGTATARFGLVLGAYVLMDNHYHLMLCTPAANLSRAMQWLNVRYTIAFNRRHKRVGHLFQGRFKSLLIDEEAWLVIGVTSPYSTIVIGVTSPYSTISLTLGVRAASINAHGTGASF